jgi:polysaccharide chain length determinant protein (PEP-CTERM system associated)
LHQSEERKQLKLEDYWAIVRRRRWWLLGPLFLGWALVVGGTWSIPAMYRSETLIIVEQQKVPEQYVVPNVVADLQQRLQSMTQQILSRTRLQGIIQTFHLYGGERNVADSESLVERMRQDIKIDLVPAPGRPGELTAFKISYAARTPILAQQVTGELTSLFIEENLRNRQQQSEDTTAFLQNQLEDARKDLAQQEQRLREFKTKYLGQLPEQLQSNVQILAGLQGQLQAATEALDHARQQKLYLESLLQQNRALRSANAESATASPSSLDDELDKLKAQYADLSTRYTENHPDVVRLKQQIASTERLKKQSEADLKAGKTPVTASRMAQVGPIAQVEGQLKANELEISNRTDEVKRLQAEIDQYRGRLNLTPVREEELSAITRDHEQSKENYQSLLAKKQQSELATNLEKRQQGEQFRIIDPPSLPLKPFFPDRFKMSLVGIAFGLVLALGLTAVMETVAPRIYKEEDLRDLISAPVLAGIPSLLTAEEQQQKRKFIWVETAAASFLLLLIPALTFLVYRSG